jgi:hypothetical protein
MALPVIAPVITRTRRVITQTSQRTLLKLVPEIESGSSLTNRTFTILMTISMILVSMAIFVISALSTQDAFTLAKLQREAQSLSDERDSINRQLAFQSSPNALAVSAIKLGMKPNTQPRFIDLSEDIQSLQKVKNG